VDLSDLQPVRLLKKYTLVGRQPVTQYIIYVFLESHLIIQDQITRYWDITGMLYNILSLSVTNKYFAPGGIEIWLPAT